MDELTQMQQFVRMQPTGDAIDCKCPKLVRITGFSMIDALAYVVDDFAKCPDYLMDCDEVLGYRGRLPLKILKYHIPQFLSLVLSMLSKRLLARCPTLFLVLQAIGYAPQNLFSRSEEPAGPVLAKIKYHWKEREVQFQNR
jgi:hypothetical protein